MRLAIVGTGYVGLTTGVCFAEQGHRIICYDIDEEKIENLKKGYVPFYEPKIVELIKKNSKRLSFTARIKDVKDADVIFIAVGTPSKDDGSADLKYVIKAAENIGEIIDKHTVIVNKSTVPICTGELIEKIIKEKNKDVDVVSNPEFLREGSAVCDCLYPDRIILGCGSKRAEKIMRDLYKNFKNVTITDIKSAEMIKYVSNTFLALCISYCNAYSQKYDGFDVVTETNKLKSQINPKGFFNIGLGFGGSCFKKDVSEFAYFLKKTGINSNLIESILTVNEKQKELAVSKLEKLLGNLKGKNIGVWGISFKPNTDDVRDAPFLTIKDSLLNMGANLKVYDPKARFEADYRVRSAKEAIKDQDALLIVTEWDEFKKFKLEDVKKLLKKPNIVDGRNIYERKEAIDLGFNYESIGLGDRKIEIDVVERFLDVSASYAKLIFDACNKIGADVTDVMKGIASDTRINNKPFEKFFKGKYVFFDSLYEN